MFENMKLGILGGGQLGTMLIRHATDLGINVLILDKSADSPGGRYTSSFVCANPNSYDDVLKFGEQADVITIEMEAVNTAALYELEQKGKKVYPTPATIEVIQDKYKQKQFLEANGIPVAKCVPINGKEELYNYTDRLPGCLKKRRDGYDGKGVMMLKSTEDIAEAFTEPSILEEAIAIDKELAVIVARNERGEVKCYEPVYMEFSKTKFVLEYQVSPAPIPTDKAEEAKALATKIAEALNLVGILAVEMFLTEGNEVLVNELAPRPHNSGHHTIESCVTSQYEQHLRAILGLPLGETTEHGKSVMINILAPEGGVVAPEALSQLMAIGNAHLHWYGKHNSKAGRKIGHITITDADMAVLVEKANRVKSILNYE